MGWTAIGSVVQNIVNLVLVGVLARLLEPKVFGVANVAYIVLGFLFVLGQAGIVSAVVQLPKLDKEHIGTAQSLSIISSFILAVIVFFGSGLIGSMMGSPESAGLIAAFSVSFFIQGLSLVHIALIQRSLGFKYLSLIDSASYILGYGVVSIVLALLGFGPWSIVLGSSAQTLIKTVAVMKASGHRIKLRWDKEVLREVGSFQAGHTLVALMGYVAVTADNAVVGRTLGTSALGIYRTTYSLATMPASILEKVVMRVLFAGASRLQDDPVRLAQIHRRALSMVSLLAVPASVFLFLEAPNVIGVLLGPKWKATVVPFQIMLIYFLPRLAYTLNITILSATGNPMRRALPAGSYAVGVILAAIIGARTIGINGVAAGVGLAVVSFDLGLLYLIGKVVHQPMSRLITPYAAGIPTGLLMLVTIFPLTLWHTKHPVLHLLVATMVAGAAMLLAAKFASKLFFGEHHAWFVTTVKTQFNPRRFLKGRKLGGAVG